MSRVHDKDGNIIPINSEEYDENGKLVSLTVHKSASVGITSSFKTPIKLSESQIQKANDYRRDHTPIVRTERKIGRNNPCSCRSGLKFKKCCISKRSRYS